MNKFIAYIAIGRYPYDDILQRDKLSMDIFWLKESLEDSENLPAPDIIAKEIAENPESELEQFASIHEDLTINDGSGR